MAALYRIGNAYLNRDSPISSGGVTGLILDNVDFINGTIDTTKIQDLRTWSTYANQFLFNESRFIPILKNQTYQFDNLTSIDNPNRGLSIIMIFWLCTFLLLISALAITSVLQYLKDEKERQVIKLFKFISMKRKRCIIKSSVTKRILVIISMSTVIILWIIFMVLMCTTQYLISSKLTNNTATKNNGTETQLYASLNDAVTLSFQYLGNFFFIVTNNTGILLNSSLSMLSLNIRSQLSISIVGFGNQVLTAFNITDLFNTAQTLINSITQVINSMTFINGSCQNILAEVDSIKGSVSVYQSSINNNLINICKALNNETAQQKVCQTLQTRNSFFITGIQTGLVDPNSSILMIMTIQQYHFNITDISNSFNKVNNAFKTNLNTMFNKSLNQFNMSSYLSIVTEVWGNIIKNLSPAMNTTMSYGVIIGSALDTVSKYENFVIIMLILLIFVIILLLLLFSFRDSIQDRSLNRYLDFSIQLAFVCVLIVSASVCVSVLVFTNFSQSEICNQLNTTTGLNVLDQMLNKKLSNPWKTLTKSAVSSYEGVNLTVDQPMNILSGIKDRCKNTSLGLFSVMEMGNFINVSQIVRSKSIMTIVLNAENSSLKAFLDVDPTQIIPQDLTSFIAQTASIIAYFDGIDYKTGIKELQKPLVGISNFTEYFDDLSLFITNSSQSLGWTSDLISLNNTVNKLLTVAPNWTLTQLDINNLSQNFQILQNNRNNSSLMNQLLLTMTNVKSLFGNSSELISLYSSLFNKVIIINLLNTVDQIISSSFYMIVHQMIPCGNLSLIFEAMTTTVCSHSNFNVSLATFGVLLLIETILCQIISVLVITSASLRLNSESNVSKC